MTTPPTYAGTRGRAPCPDCDGRGYSWRWDGRQDRRVMCVVCNGTRVRPTSRPVAAERASARVAGIRRAQRAR